LSRFSVLAGPTDLLNHV